MCIRDSDNRLAFVDIQGLPGQDQLEELVTAGTDGANLINIVVIIEHLSLIHIFPNLPSLSVSYPVLVSKL